MPSLRSTLRWLLSTTIVILFVSLQGCAASAGKAYGKYSTIRTCDGHPPLDDACVCKSPSAQQLCKGRLPGTVVAQRGDSVVAMAPLPEEYWLGRDKSYELTPAERERFVEASNRFKKYVIPQGINHGGIFWLDNERLAFSSREYPGWKAKPQELSRIVSYHLLTGEIVDSGYRGDLICLNHLGDMMIHHADRHYDHSLRLENYQWFIGKWGKPLQQVELLWNSFIPPYLCRFASYGDPIYRDPPEELRPDAAKVTPLLPQHGAIRETVVRANGKIQDRLHLVKPNGEVVPLGEKRLSHYFFVYQPWDDKYFELALPPSEPRFIAPSGAVHTSPVPSLLRGWTRNLYASIAAYTSGRGLIWGVQQNTGYWQKQGIFLQAEKNLLRIDEGRPMPFIKSSPDGCKLSAAVDRGDPRPQYNQRPLNIVIDLCKENDK